MPLGWRTRLSTHYECILVYTSSASVDRTNARLATTRPIDLDSYGAPPTAPSVASTIHLFVLPELRPFLVKACALGARGKDEPFLPHVRHVQRLGDRAERGHGCSGSVGALATNRAEPVQCAVCVWTLDASVLCPPARATSERARRGVRCRAPAMVSTAEQCRIKAVTLPPDQRFFRKMKS